MLAPSTITFTCVRLHLHTVINSFDDFLHEPIKLVIDVTIDKMPITTAEAAKPTRMS